MEYCPNKSVINFATTTLHLTLVHGKKFPRLRQRCDWCHFERGRTRKLKSLGVLADDDQGPICLVNNCLDFRWDRSSHCVSHLPNGIKKASRRRKSRRTSETKQALLSPGNNKTWMDGDVWQSSSRFRLIQLLLEDLRDREWTNTNGYRPKVLILDNEFVGLNLDGPITQTSLLDLCTNEMLVDVCVKRDPEKLVSKDMFGRLDPMAEYLYKSKYRSPTADRQVCSAYESSKLVKESGITSDDYILEWSLHPLDVPRLRLMLSNSGFQNVLPPDAHCVSLIPDFRLNIPNTISLALKFIFPMLHPGHILVGTNHNSDSDVRMTRLMVLFLLERLDPTTRDPDFLGVWALQVARERRIRLALVSERTKRRLAKETPEARRIRLLGKRTMWRAKETPERRRIRNAAISEKIEKETPEERRIRQVARSTRRRANETPDRRKVLRARAKMNVKERRAKETPEARSIRLAVRSAKAKRKKAKETFGNRRIRLAKILASARRKIAEETPERRSVRFAKIYASEKNKESKRDPRETKSSNGKNHYEGKGKESKRDPGGARYST